jgi:predicted nucleic acid-binding Zn ribbon protein
MTKPEKQKELYARRKERFANKCPFCAKLIKRDSESCVEHKGEIKKREQEAYQLWIMNEGLK